MKHLSVLALLGLLPMQAAAQILEPIDETSSDAAFEQFLTELRFAVSARDSGAVARMAAPDVLVGFGGDLGPEALARLLETMPGHWDDLERALGLGSVALWDRARAEWSFCAPYPACVDLPIADEEAMFSAVVIVPDAPAYRRYWPPGPEVIATLNYDVLPFLGYLEGGQLAVVVLPDDGPLALVEARHIYPAAGYRAYFELDDDGNWRVSAIVGGD